MFLGATGRDVCPVVSILSYMVLRGHDTGFFFRFSNGIGLTRDRFVSAVRSVWTALDTTLLFTWAIASVSVKLPPWLSVGYRTL